VASAEALSLFGDGVDGDGWRRLNNGKPWKTMENNGVFAALQKK
jgi:hypothetical protein